MDIVKIYFDIETYINYNGLVIPYLIGWITDLEPDKFYYSTEPHQKFFDTLARLSKIYRLQLWAHNAMYDLLGIYPVYLMNMDHKSEKIWQVSEANNFIRFKYVGTKINKIVFECYDTFMWRRGSLAKWGKELCIEGLAKGDIDYDKRGGYCEIKVNKIYYKNSIGRIKSVDLQEELNYLFNDVKIVKAIVERINIEKTNIINVYNINMGKRDPKTIPSFSKYVLNCLMGGNDKIDKFNSVYKAKVDVELGKIMENSTMGGFTAFNKKYMFDVFKYPFIKCYDINSMYPWVMSQGLPYGEFVKKSKTTMTWFKCTCTFVEWKEEYSFFSRCVVPKKFTEEPFFMCEMYLNLIKKVSNNDIQVIEEYYQEFSVRDDINIVIEKAFTIKADPNTDSITKDACKLTMNSLFGKFMERNYHEDYYYDIEAKDFLDYHPENPRPYRFNLTGVYIVQVAQSVLINTVIKEHEKGNIFLYCDTDSIKMVQLKKPSFIIGRGLGEWKFEGEYHIFKCNGKAKKYLLWNYDEDPEYQQVKMSGIKEKIQSFILDNFILDELLILFDRECNVLIKKGKTASGKTALGQDNIRDVDIEFNRGIKVTHVLDMEQENFLVEKDED